MTAHSYRHCLRSLPLTLRIVVSCNLMVHVGCDRPAPEPASKPGEMVQTVGTGSGSGGWWGLACLGANLVLVTKFILGLDPAGKAVRRQLKSEK